MVEWMGESIIFNIQNMTVEVQSVGGNVDSTPFRFTNLDQLQAFLKAKGWTEDKLNILFSSVNVAKNFPEISLTEAELADLSSRLNKLQGRFEQQNLLRIVVRNKLREEIESITFDTTHDICSALKERWVEYPDAYLTQDPANSSFIRDFKGPRTLSMAKYEELITALKWVSWDDVIARWKRWEIIRSAFWTPVVSVASDKMEVMVDSVTLLTLKKSLENEVSNPVTVGSLTKLLDKLALEKDPDGKKVIVSYLWSKLAVSGYVMTIQWNKFSIQHNIDQKNTELLEATLSAYMGAGKLTISELQRAILVWSWSFGAYLDTQKVDIKNISTDKYALFLWEALKIDIIKWTPAQKIQAINKSSATPDEKAFLISYVNGGFAWYNLAPDALRQVKLREASSEFLASPQYATVVSSVDRVSSGGVARERAQMAQEQKPKELTIETFMDNPMLAISKYPWVSLTLLIGGIWKFWFMKTIGGLLLGMVGIKAVNELGNTELGREMKGNLVGWAKQVAADLKGTVSGSVAPIAAPAAPTVRVQFDEKNISEFQKAWVAKIRGNDSLLEVIVNLPKKKKEQNATLDDYLKVVHVDSIQNITLDKIIYTNDIDQSIFSNQGMNLFPTTWDIPDNMSRYLLKKVLRTYIGMGQPLSAPGNNLKEWQVTLDEFKTKFPEAAWKTKTLKDLITEIYKK